MKIVKKYAVFCLFAFGLLKGAIASSEIVSAHESFTRVAHESSVVANFHSKHMDVNIRSHAQRLHEHASILARLSMYRSQHSCSREVHASLHKMRESFHALMQHRHTLDVHHSLRIHLTNLHTGFRHNAQHRHSFCK